VDYYKKKTVKHFKVYDALICNTKRHYSVFSWHRNSWYIPWGTDLDRFKPTLKKHSVHLNFIHSAGWSPYRKGTDLAIKAFSGLMDKNARLIIHMQISLEDFLAEFPELEQILKTDNRIRIITEPIKPEEFYSLGEVYLYPTRLEGIGLTQVEALACGIPIIVPNDGPMNEFALDPISKTTPISRYWERVDSYYWSMNEVSIEALISNLQWFSTHYNPSESWTRPVRLVAEEYFDANKNMANLGFLLEGVETSTKRYHMLKIKTYSTKLVIMSSPSLFRLSQMIRKFI
jgi:glycosyltransferase involved in cell wall biosynthesis